MGQEEALLLAPAAVSFSWEHEKGVLMPVSAPALDAGGMTQSPRKAPAPAPATVVLSGDHEPGLPKTKPVSAQAPTRRLSVPPPPGRPSTRDGSRAVRPEDDPFLAAYLACTKSTGDRGDSGKMRTTTGGREHKSQGQRRFAWAGLSCSCKRGGIVVEQSMVRLAKLPELDPRET